ncbi:hypothetical protein ACLOJK_007649 [Asimina triloba]
MHPRSTNMEHLWCSITFKRWVAAMAATTAVGEEHGVATGGTHARPSSPSRRCRTTACEPPPTSPPPCTVDVVEEGKLATVRTHHAHAVVAPIQATHHDGDDAHIPDLLRSQADVDHRGHTRRVFLARHQQIQLNLAPIKRCKAFLLKPISPSIFFKSLLPFSRHQRGLDQWIQAVHRSVHRRPPLSPPSDAPTADVATRARLRLPTSLPTRSPPPLPAARIHRIHPCCPRRPSTATITWPESAAKHRPPTM